MKKSFPDPREQKNSERGGAKKGAIVDGERHRTAAEEPRRKRRTSFSGASSIAREERIKEKREGEGRRKKLFLPKKA